ncbi:hypothetical protein B4N89_43300 [Embleya scabrispora]|uniref:Uncharacterized protein n=1 Tax=Embleya scabrispora TaxID=159449 RepID=A0A1T3NKH2_9ACTN|nr:hypothetical protein [Embleya scabrispora]OPC77349.1 hypothetical protein B4N89_43300 [Embleya scabrispora]
MSLVTTRRRNTVRTLAGTVLAAALLIPTATACDSDDKDKSTAPTAGAKPADNVPPADRTSAPATAPAPGAPGTGAPTGTTKPKTGTPPATAPKGGSTGGGKTLVDGSTAQIENLGAQRYRARIVNGGQVLATLETNDKDAGLDANGMFVVLSMDGTIHSWMGGEHTGPGTFQLPGGWTAEVTKVGELRFRARILGDGGADYGTLEANRHDAGAVANGIYIVLSAGGEISAHE